GLTRSGTPIYDLARVWQSISVIQCAGHRWAARPLRSGGTCARFVRRLAMSGRRWPKAIGFLLLTVLFGAACGSSSTATGPKMYKVGVSNTFTVSGFREEMICSIKAQAKASGIVSQVIVANRNTDPSGQIADIRNLI